jgi:hypothetical protein
MCGRLRVLTSARGVAGRYNDLKLDADRKAKELRESLDTLNAIKVIRLPCG